MAETKIAKEDKPAIYAMRSRGCTLQEIATTFFGVSRERIRQICKKGDAWPPPKPLRLYPKKFGCAMRRHLYAAGIYWCCVCRRWLGAKQFPPIPYNRCRECNTKRKVAAYHAHLEQSRAVAVKWQRANRDKCKEYTRRYLAKRKQRKLEGAK